MPDVQQDAETLYEYHQLHTEIDKADAIFCLCSLDTRVAERAAQLFLDGYGDYLIFSGGSGKLTQGRFDKPEAEIFADIARRLGVPETKLIIEPQSTNTGENFKNPTWSAEVPFATFKKQWPDPCTEILVTSPRLTWDKYPNKDNPVDLVINIAVGDLIRIRDYPAKGFQIPQDIPENVWAAAQRLIQKGYNSHLP
ncbi:hypothetical protein GQX73_g4022 [Xylaria multiplex]|uniref:DUF218 domain-containing protein n=1 Tax=Xylaria multiplex TaxID=323545 RepID=A0A7C8MW71_9PEZI|nr:hypothetical protein GQX73_g4022 [Xylaria multiplex]